jgi:hypothetical protein
MQSFEPIYPAISYYVLPIIPVGLRYLLQSATRQSPPKAKIRCKKDGVIRTQRLRSDPLPFDLRASSTSTLLYTSPYPLRTVLGVALPAISLLLLSISSLARCRSADSRFSLASSWEGGPSGSDVRDPPRGRFQSLREKEGEVRGEEFASCELIDVRGSAFDLRFKSRVLCRWDVRNLPTWKSPSD